MRISDELKSARGIFTLDIFRRGELLEHYTDDNLIVDQGRANVALLLGGDGSGLSITKIGFGTNNSVALPGNSSLVGAYVKTIDSHSYPTATSVLFSFSLASGEANNMQINEFGLLTTSGLLHARKVRGGPLAKESDLSLSGTWQLLY